MIGRFQTSDNEKRFLESVLSGTEYKPENVALVGFKSTGKKTGEEDENLNMVHFTSQFLANPPEDITPHDSRFKIKLVDYLKKNNWACRENNIGSVFSVMVDVYEPRLARYGPEELKPSLVPIKDRKIAILYSV